MPTPDKTEAGYSMRLGDADTERLKLLGRFYDPNSAAFIESAGVAAGDSVVDLGRGHGSVTDRIAARVGDTGTVYAVDASADQLRIARSTLVHRHSVTFIEGAVEDDPLRGVHVDWALRLLRFGAPMSVAADDQGRMKPDALRDALADGNGPSIVCAQAGNAASGAFDAFEPIADACATHHAWLHIDGAFGLWARSSFIMCKRQSCAGRWGGSHVQQPLTDR